MTQAFGVSCEREGSIVRIVAAGELDSTSVPQLRRECERDHPDEVEVIVVDLSRVSFMDSTGVRALLDARGRCGERLTILLSRQAARVVDLVGLRAVLPIVTADELDALLGRHTGRVALRRRNRTLRRPWATR